MTNSDIADALTKLFASRAPAQEKMRGTLGNGLGVVLYTSLADYCYVRLRSSTRSIVIAHNIKVPMKNNIDVDLLRSTENNKTIYEVIGLTGKTQTPYGEQPWANVSLHGYTHAPGGYDPIGIRYATTLVASTYTAMATDELLLVDTSVARAIALPDATTLAIGHVLTVVDATGGAGANNIVITPSGTQSINGSASYTINTNRGVVRMVTDSHNWFII